MTTLHLTPDGHLIYARRYGTAEAAQASVAAEQASWERKVNEYSEKGLVAPVQFTPVGQNKMIVWDGKLVPTLDAWGKAVK